MDAKRFWSKVNKEGPTQPHMETNCWLWTGATNQRYGHLRPSSIEISDWPTYLIYAHHASWVLAHGPIPVGLQILHRCGAKLCVRSDHLYAGTASDKGNATVALGRHQCWVLDYEKAQEIRRCAKRGMPRRSIAEKFGITIPAVGVIINNRSWTIEAEQAKHKKQRLLEAYFAQRAALQAERVEKAELIRQLKAQRAALQAERVEKAELIRQLKAAALSYAAIGRRVGLSRERVRQIFLTMPERPE